uniref:Uncharacterized protein n=1 Tax=Oryza glumipatula TaxID=40148 RepID=A0A0E0AFS2_9ORYZ
MGMSSPANTGRTGRARWWMEQARPRQYCNHGEEFDGGGSLSLPAPWEELMLTAGRRHRWVVVGWGHWWAVASGVADERWGRAATSGAGGGLRRRRIGCWGWVVVTPRRALGESSDVGCWGRWWRRRVQRWGLGRGGKEQRRHELSR